MKEYFKYLIVTVMFVFAVTTSCKKDNENSFIVTFNSNGGSVVEAITVKQNKKIDEPAAPTLDKYIFAGWYMDNHTFEYKWNFVINTVTENIILNAKWEENIYTVTFNSNGGSAVGAVTVKQDEKVVEPVAPTRNNHNFVGWYMDNNTFEYKWNFAVNTVTEDIILYAKWEEIIAYATYTVTFNSNGGSFVEPITVKQDAKINQPATPIWGNYIFVGWYYIDSDTFMKEWDFAVNNITKNVTLYAKWIIEGVKEFTSSTTWIVPAGVTSVDVFCVGGGGSGAGDFGTARFSGSGGNGGVVTYMENVSVIPGASIIITVGAGGIGGKRFEGRPGGVSSFGDLVISSGGYGGTDPRPDKQPNSGRGGRRGFSDGYNYDFMRGEDGIECPLSYYYSTSNRYGAGGAGANNAYTQTSLQQYGGATGGGNSGYGNDNTPQNKGLDATFYGGGGGGAAFSSNHTYSLGGNGSAGIVIIRY